MSLESTNIKQSSFDRGVSPVWAQLLSQGTDKPMDYSKSDPNRLLNRYYGKSLLDRHTNPIFNKMKKKFKLLPDSVKADVFKQNLKWSLNKKLNMTLGKNKLDLNWRF